jgi:aminoglycoside phosphotransferase (APT) family kinase protein
MSDATNASLRRMGLIGPQETPALSMLAGGVSSLIVRVDAARGAFCFKQALPKLNVAADWYAPVERNDAEVAWLEVAGAVLPGITPEVLGADPQAHAFAMSFLDTGVFPVWKRQLLEGHVDDETARATGAALAAIHAACAGDDALARRFANAEAFIELRLDPYLRETARVHRDLAPVLDAIVTTTDATRLTLVHGDVSPKNILAGGPCGIVLLDAECANYGDPAFDLTFCLNHLLLKAAARPADAQRYHGAFHALLEAYRVGISWEPVRDLEARATALLAGLFLARVDGKSPVEYLSESAREHVRVFARRALVQPFASLDAFAGAWYATGL